MLDLLDPTMAFLARYGLAAIFVLLVMDAAMLMPVLPGEIIMIMAVARYARSFVDLVLLVGMATLASMVGSLLLYAVCRKGGRNLIEKHPRLFMMDPRRRERMERLFAHPAGQSLVLFLRIIPLTRILVNIPAGLAKMRLGRFVLLSTIGMLVFHAGFMYMTYSYGADASDPSGPLTVAYASPAWDYVKANQVVTLLVFLALGVLLSVRASRNMLKDPEWAAPSVLGWLAERIVLMGGLAILVTLWFQRSLVFDLARYGGLDLARVAEGLNWDPVSFIVVVTVPAMLLALLLILFGNRARDRRRAALAPDEAPMEEAEVFLKFDAKTVRK